MSGEDLFMVVGLGCLVAIGFLIYLTIFFPGGRG